MSQKLELTRVGKDKQYRLEPRVLIENPDLSYGDPSSENMLIHGDNLLALKALEQEYTGKIKCIYIDPPYNTGNAFEHYDDGLEHSEWLNLMKPRLELLYRLLHDDGMLAIQIDDNEFSKLHLLMSEIAGQKNLKTIVIKMAEPTGVKMAHVINSGIIPKLKEYIIICSKNGVKGLTLDRVKKEEWDSEYKIFAGNISKEELLVIKQIINNEDRSVKDVEIADQLLSKIIFENSSSIYELEGGDVSDEEGYINRLYENAWRIFRSCSTTGTSKILADEKRDSCQGSCFSVVSPKKKMYIMRKDYNIESSQPRIKLLFADDYLTVHPGDLRTDIKTTGLGNEGGVDFPKSKKPEQLLRRIINMCTSDGDIVLDSFLGSGTTSAVAHKMNRKYIGIELGDHAYSHSKVRLDKVIDGVDQQGISSQVNREGGGGYKFYELGPSLLAKDKYGNYVINPSVNGLLLIQSLCKIENFSYKAFDGGFKHGYSTEKDFIHITTRHVTQDIIDEIAEHQLLTGETLLIMCTTYAPDLSLPDAVSVKKIPLEVMNKCEYGDDVDYSLPVSSLDHNQEEDVE